MKKIIIGCCLFIFISFAVYADHQISDSIKKCLKLEDIAEERYYLKNKGIIKAIYIDENEVEQQGFYVSLDGMKEINYRYGLVVLANKCWMEEMRKKSIGIR